jgi:hypothetical protein
MATTYTDTLFETKYKDDYSDSAGFYRILYNSGKVLQARELTQMQTLINKQMERIGNNIFKEGAVVKPGGLSVDTGYEFVKLDVTSSSTAANVGDVITGTTSGVKAEVLEVVAASGSDPATYFVRYVDTSGATASTTTPRFQAGESLGSGRIVQITNTVANPAIGTGTRATVGESIYFTQGFFVYTESQTTIVSKYSDAPDAELGFKMLQDVVSVNDDTSLYDNQGGVPNTTAPGADRYRIRLVLTTKANVLATENFIHVATVKKGAIFTAVSAQQNLQYNIPRDMVATRIRENSGDYIVKPFRMTFDEDSANTHLLLKVSDGIVVVDGYRAARFSPTDLRIAKPTETLKINGEFTPVDYGNYLDVLADSAIGGPDIKTFAAQDIMNQRNFAGGTSAKIGEVRVRAVHENGANLKFHIFDIQMNSGQNFRDARSIGTDSNNFFNPTITGTNTVIEDPLNNSLLYSAAHSRPRIVDPQQVEVQILRSGTSDGSGNFTVSIPTQYALDNAGDWLIFTDAANGGLLNNGSLGGLTTGSSTTTITGLPASAPIKAYVYGSTSSPTIRAKTLATNQTVAAPVTTDPTTGEQIINLAKPDIFKVHRVSLVDSDGADVEYKFSLDNGKRDNFYGLGRMVLNSGQSAPSGNVYVKFDHFNHGAGNFFAVNSYTGVVDYDKIPDYRLSNGQLINLRDALDFRPVVNSSGNFTEANISYLPQPTDLVTSDTTYYLAGSYKLVIDKEGNFDIINGQEAFSPSFPEAPNGTMALYNFRMGANTLNEEDVSSQKIDHRRYTMDDINQLDKRLSNLEELTSLNMLELETSNFEVLDSAGLNRTKSGFFVDNFTTHVFSDVTNSSYRAAIDPSEGLMRPAFSEDNIRMIFDSDNSVGVVRKGDNIYPAFTEETYISQPFATKAVAINPYTTSVFDGNLVISPASDEWRDINVQSRTVIDGGSKLSTNLAANWNSWEWNWGGKDIEDLEVGDKTNTITKTSNKHITKTVNKIVSEQTVEEVIGQRVLQVALLPFIRSRIVSIKARGLRPNSNVFLFFDGKLMSDYVREEAFVRYSSTTVDYGNTLRNQTTHKDGSTALTSDISGAVDISFQIPNNSTFRFRAGTHEIKVMDVSVPDEKISGTIARGSYVAQGFLDTVHQDIKSTRMLEVEGQKTMIYTPAATYNASSDGGDGGYSGQGVKIVNGQGSSWTNKPKDDYGVGFAGEFDTSNAQGKKALDAFGGPGPDVNEGGSGSKIICTALHQMGLLPYDIFAADQEYGRQLAETHPDIVDGYHAWAQIVVDWMNGVEDAPNVAPWITDDAKRIEHTSNWAIRWAQAIATPWAIQMAHEMGIREKGSKLGKFLMYVGYPISGWVGKSGKKPSAFGMIALFALLRLIVLLGGEHKYIDNTVTEQK